MTYNLRFMIFFFLQRRRLPRPFGPRKDRLWSPFPDTDLKKQIQCQNRQYGVKSVIVKVYGDYNDFELF
jgi:hypothetical protein